MSEYLPNHYLSIEVLKHKNLPVFYTGEFDFYRCVPFDTSFYGKTVSELHKGNLREKRTDNRYSMLFSGWKVSYWADSSRTARAEMKKHNKGKNLLTFFAYDDATSTYPTLNKERELLKIVDGREFGFHIILKKDDLGIPLSEYDKELIKKIEDEQPDCLAYYSEAVKNGINFLFFEKGFNKLAIRELSLRLGNENKICKNTIYCAGTCDYMPYLESYGDYFMPKAKIKHDNNYEKSQEFFKRQENEKHFWSMRMKDLKKSGNYFTFQINENGTVLINDKT